MNIDILLNTNEQICVVFDEEPKNSPIVAIYRPTTPRIELVFRNRGTLVITTPFPASLHPYVARRCWSQFIVTQDGHPVRGVLLPLVAADQWWPDDGQDHAPRLLAYLDKARRLCLLAPEPSGDVEAPTIVLDYTTGRLRYSDASGLSAERTLCAEGHAFIGPHDAIRLISGQTDGDTRTVPVKVVRTGSLTRAARDVP